MKINTAGPHAALSRTSKKVKGFTLVEVLLTMAILSMVMLTAAYAYNFITQNWQRNQQLYERELQQYMSTALVYRAVADTQPKIVKSEATASARSAGSRPGFYFLGRDNGFTGYTNTAAQDAAYPAIYRLFREQTDNGNYNLVYEEALLNNVLLTTAEQNLPFSFRLVIARDLESLNFEYFGWESAEVRMSADPDTGDTFAEPQWFEEFDGMARIEHPLIVQVIIEDFLWPIEVIDISSELLSRTFGEEQ